MPVMHRWRHVDHAILYTLMLYISTYIHTFIHVVRLIVYFFFGISEPVCSISDIYPRVLMIKVSATRSSLGSSIGPRQCTVCMIVLGGFSSSSASRKLRECCVERSARKYLGQPARGEAGGTMRPRLCLDRADPELITRASTLCAFRFRIHCTAVITFDLGLSALQDQIRPVRQA